MKREEREGGKKYWHSRLSSYLDINFTYLTRYLKSLFLSSRDGYLLCVSIGKLTKIYLIIAMKRWLDQKQSVTHFMLSCSPLQRHNLSSSLADQKWRRWLVLTSSITAYNIPYILFRPINLFTRVCRHLFDTCGRFFYCLFKKYFDLFIQITKKPYKLIIWIYDHNPHPYEG